MVWQTYDPDYIDIDGCDANGNPWNGSYYNRNEEKEPLLPYSPPIYLYKFRTEEELVTSDVFQKHLTKCLEFKDHQIRELQEYILNII